MVLTKHVLFYIDFLIDKKAVFTPSIKVVPSILKLITFIGLHLTQSYCISLDGQISILKIPEKYFTSLPRYYSSFLDE